MMDSEGPKRRKKRKPNEFVILLYYSLSSLSKPNIQFNVSTQELVSDLLAFDGA